jgi:membrane associated rhomboid family serine protease
MNVPVWIGAPVIGLGAFLGGWVVVVIDERRHRRATIRRNRGGRG